MTKKTREFLKSTFQEFDVTHVVWSNVHLNDQAWTASIYVAQFPENWNLLQGDGKTIVFEYHPREDPLYIRPGQDWTSKAFIDRGSEFFIDAGVGEEPKPPNLWRRFAVRITVSDRQSLRALWMTECAEIQEQLAKLQTGVMLSRRRPGQQRKRRINPAIVFRNQLLPGTAILAVRAARKGVVDDPYAALSYRALAKATGVLARREESLLGPNNAGPIRYLSQYRQLIMIYALRQELERDPSDWKSHYELGQHYKAVNCWDLAAPHLQAAHDLRKGDVPEEELQRPLFQKQLQLIKDEAVFLTQQVKSRTESLDAAIEGLEAKDRIERTLAAPFPFTDATNWQRKDQFGCRLAGRRLSAINEALKIVAHPVARLLLFQKKYELLLAMGRPRQVLKELASLEEVPIWAVDRAFLETKAYAMLGCYSLMDDAFDRLETAQRQNWDPRRVADLKAQVHSQTYRVWATLAPTQLTSPGHLAASSYLNWEHSRARATVAQVRNLRGLFALEGGNIPLAKKCFREVQRMEIPPGWRRDLALASYYLRVIEKANR